MESPHTPPPETSASPTFRQLAQEWLETEGLRLVEPQNERRHVDHLEPLWALPEGQLQPLRVKQALAALLRPRGALSAATVNKVRGTGRRIIREAMVNGRWRGPNPFEVVSRMRETKPSHRTLSLSECRAVLPHLRPDRRREALAMLYLGMRPGEWKALQRQDVDLLAGTITVRRSNARDSTKTGRERTVPIPAGFLPALEEALKASPQECQLVFPGKDGRLQRPDAKLSRMLRAAIRAAGLVSSYRCVCRRPGCGHVETRRTLEPELECPRCEMLLWQTGQPIHVRFYDLRHSAATLHREAGADPLAIQIALGHAAENLTDSIYTHLSLDYVRRELDKLAI